MRTQGGCRAFLDKFNLPCLVKEQRWDASAEPAGPEAQNTAAVSRFIHTGSGTAQYGTAARIAHLLTGSGAYGARSGVKRTLGLIVLPSTVDATVA